MIKKMLLTTLVTCFCNLVYAQIGIGTTSPDKSSILDITSTKKGFLPPRVASSSEISDPATGLMIYNLAEKCIQVNTGTPSVPNWKCLNSSVGTGVVTPSGAFSGINMFDSLGGTDLRFKNIKHHTRDGHHTAGVTLDGNLYKWGLNSTNKIITNFNNGSGGYADRGRILSAYRMSHPGFDGKIMKYTANHKMYLVLTNDGKLYYWGTQRHNLMDNGVTAINAVENLVPNEIMPPIPGTKIVDVSYGFGSHSYLIITDDGKLYIRGYVNSNANVYTSFEEIPKPAGVSVDFKYTKIFEKHRNRPIFFLKGSDGEIYSCGYFHSISTYLRGNGTSNTTSIHFGSFDITDNAYISKVNLPLGHGDINYVEYSDNTAVAIDDNGVLYAWGDVHIKKNGYMSKLFHFDPSVNLGGTASTDRFLLNPEVVKLPDGVSKIKSISIAEEGGSNLEMAMMVGDDNRVYLSGRLRADLQENSRLSTDPNLNYAILFNALPFNIASVHIIEDKVSFLDNSGQFLWYGRPTNSIFGGTRNYNMSDADAYNSSDLSPLLHGKYDANNDNVQIPN